MNPIANHFETRTRDSGEKFVTLKDDAPEWLLASVRDAHQGDLPDDWTYAECQAAAELYDACNPDDPIRAGVVGSVDPEILDPHVDARVDVYTQALHAWATSHCLGSVFALAEEEANELGGERANVAAILTSIQACAIRGIAHTILEACRVHASTHALEEV